MPLFRIPPFPVFMRRFGLQQASGGPPGASCRVPFIGGTKGAHLGSWCLLLVALFWVSSAAGVDEPYHTETSAYDWGFEGLEETATYGPSAMEWGSDEGPLHAGSQQQQREWPHDLMRLPLGHFEAHEGAPVSEAAAEDLLDVPPGGGLLRLARMLPGCSVMLRAALLRHFCHAVARLKTQVVRVEGAGDGDTSILGVEPHEVTEDHVNIVAAKLGGLVRGAEVHLGGVQGFRSQLLAPLARTQLMAEAVLFGLARQHKYDAFLRALRTLGNPMEKALGYLSTEGAAAAASQLNPLRVSILARARELDRDLVHAQTNFHWTLDRYQVDLSDEVLQRERDDAAGLEGDVTYSRVGGHGVHHREGLSDSGVYIAFFLGLFLMVAVGSRRVNRQKTLASNLRQTPPGAAAGGPGHPDVGQLMNLVNEQRRRIEEITLENRERHEELRRRIEEERARNRQLDADLQRSRAQYEQQMDSRRVPNIYPDLSGLGGRLGDAPPPYESVVDNKP